MDGNSTAAAFGHAAVRVGVLGYGNVGAAVVALIADHGDTIAARTGLRLEVTRVAVRDLTKRRTGFATFTDEAASVVVDPDVDLVEAAQNLVRRTVESNRDTNRYLIIDVPDLPLGSGKPDEVDLVFDEYVDLAFRAAEWLHATHGAPQLALSDSILGRLWRSVNA
jgi:hypothetical protein